MAPLDEDIDDGPGRGDVVVGVDGTEASVGALRQGAQFARSMHVPLLAMCAWSPETSSAAAAEAVLGDATRRVFGDGPPAGFRAVASEGAPEVLLRRASEHARMLVIGSSERDPGLRTQDSVSIAIAKGARCPVVVFHATRRADLQPVGTGPA